MKPFKGRAGIEACRAITRDEHAALGKDAFLPPLNQPAEIRGRQITAAWIRARCAICEECPDMAA